MIKRAFTLIEVLAVLVIIGLIVIVMTANVKFGDYREKSNIAKVYKVINAFDEASASACDAGSTYCPLGTFMYKVGGDFQHALVLSGSSAAQKAQSAVNMFAEHIKFETTGINFCQYSGFCDGSSTNYAGAKMPGDIYIGIEYLNTIADCPEANLPEGGTVLVNKPLSGNAKCWAKLYVDINGTNPPNTLGNDVYIFGFSESGLYH